MSWMRRRDHNIFLNLGSLGLCGLLAGVVVAAAFFPGVALSGLIAQAAAEQFDQLPTDFDLRQAPQMSYIYASDSKTVLATIYDEHRRDIPLTEVPQVMIDALVATEDKTFYEHNGVDPRGIMRAFVANQAADATTQGASTITQQLVRMSISYFAEDPEDVIAATEDTIGRKLREARMAIGLEKRMTKAEILEDYFNLAYFGHGAYGIFAASQVYFGVAPKDLTLPQAALLAGLVQAPSAYDPGTEEGLPKATDRRDWVLEQMVVTGAITPAEAAEAKATEVEVQAERQPNDCVATTKNHWGFFCDFFYRWWLEQEEFGATRYDRERQLKGGGFQITTTLDVDIQASAKKHIEDYLETGEKHALMLAAIEPGSGKVRALAVNRKFAIDDPEDPQNGPHTNPALRRQDVRGSYPNTTNPLLTGGGDVTGYQAGSTFKIFTIVAALKQGLPLDYSFYAPHQYTTKYPVAAGGPASCGQRWCPSNYANANPGRYNMWTGLGLSINTYFAQLIERAGAADTVDVAQDLGIRFRAPNDANLAANAATWGAFTLGVSSTTPLDLANAYATLAAEGIHCDPTPVEEIRTMDGDTLDIAEPDCERVIEKDVARAAIDAARCVVGVPSRVGNVCRGGTATRVNGTWETTRSLIDGPFFGKSGTTDAEKTASLVLSSSELTVAGMLADPDWAQTNKRMKHAIVNPPVMYTLADAMEKLDGENWPEPSAKLAYGDQRRIPSVTCRSVNDARSILRDAGFDVYVTEDEVDSDCPAGQVAGTNPSGRTVRGGTVGIEISNGSGFSAPDPDDGPDPGDGPGNEPGPGPGTTPRDDR